MALPSSGVLTLADIQTEFGGTNPISLSEYYRGGGLVPDSGLNAAIPTSGAISVSDFYGAANIVPLDLTVQGAQVNRPPGTYTGVSIGTANASRMVVLQGSTNGAASTYTAPTSITINGTAMTKVSYLSSFIAWAKVPTGTTADIVITGGNVSAAGYATRIITLNTINTTATQTAVSAVTLIPGSAGGISMTTNPVATDGVFIWSGTYWGGGPYAPFMRTISNNPSGAVITLTAANSNLNSGGVTNFGAYSTCSTTDSRYAQLTGNTGGSKSNAYFYGSFAYFEAN